jgi:hypothetical protein
MRLPGSKQRRGLRAIRALVEVELQAADYGAFGQGPRTQASKLAGDVRAGLEWIDAVLAKGPSDGTEGKGT